MKADYYTKAKVLVIEDGLRCFGDVPNLDNFDEHPAVKRFLNSACLRDATLKVTKHEKLY